MITQEEALQARNYMKEISDEKIGRRLEVIALKGEGMRNNEIT